jgi:hypothetical protein
MATTYVTSSLISYQENEQIFGGTMTGANWSSIRNSGTSTEGYVFDWLKCRNKKFWKYINAGIPVIR